MLYILVNKNASFTLLAGLGYDYIMNMLPFHFDLFGFES